MPAISDRTRLEQAQSGWVFRTTCIECSKPITLECGPDPREQQGFSMLEKFADATVCDSCDRAENDRRARRDRDRELKSRLDDTDVPARFRALKWEDMDRTGKRTAAIDAARRWAAAPHAGGLLLYGPWGTGKTRLAATACWARLQRDSCRWCAVASLIARLETSFGDDDRKDAVRVLTGSDALVLDDVDKIPMTDRARQQLFGAINNRIDAAVPLLVTTNAAPGEFSSKFGAAIASRLLGYCDPYLMDGPDRRLELSESGERMPF